MAFPPDKAALRERVEAKLMNFLAELKTRQTAYHAAHGRYWNGPRNPAAVPSDEDPAARMDPAVVRAPRNRPAYESWGAFLGGALPRAGTGFSVAVVCGTRPDRYRVVVFLKIGSTEYRRILEQGATESDTDWRKARWCASRPG